ncbi:MAG: 4'-phosphopantetheinyl transferase superfamily protein [Muribaculaceae bacterium]|nr:4'-phosphopantetheinyl transferase superfamily protein [Muribaculaceae bacterium]
MDEFLYERDKAPCGVAVELIYGADDKSAKVWKLFAMQILSESEGDYRAVSHLDNGAPILDGTPQRISISHTSHFLAMASLPKTPDMNLEEVNERTAMGIDIEKSDRAQVLRIKEKFLSDKEFDLLPSVEKEEDASDEDIKRHILAWTCKEALYKAVMGQSADWKNDYTLITLPKIASKIKDATTEKYGEAKITLHDPERVINMHLSSWEAEGHVLTLAFSPKIAKFPVG